MFNFLNKNFLYKLLFLLVVFFYVFTRIFMYLKYGQISFGYDTGIYRHYIIGYFERFGDSNFYMSYDMDVTDLIIELDEKNLFGLQMSELSLEEIHFHILNGQYGYIPPSHN